MYDPRLSYTDNYAHGPYGDYAIDDAPKGGAPTTTFAGIPVRQPFGIPAGPLINRAFVRPAFALDFDLCVYKTVRSTQRTVNPFPNILSVHVDGDLTIERAAHPLLADTAFGDPQHLSISNSFGVPSMSPDVWQPDMQLAVEDAGVGQLLIGGFQGTRREGATDGGYVQDHVTTAGLVLETGARVLELNLSCPNEGTSNLLCFDTDRVVTIVDAVKSSIGDVPLLIKLAYFRDDTALKELIRRTAPIVDGYSTINTIPAPLVDAAGNQALPGAGRLTSGVCGDAVRWAGLDMVRRIARYRDEFSLDFTITGVGGVMTAAHVAEYRAAGADAVMSATGAMWNARLAQAVLRPR